MLCDIGGAKKYIGRCRRAEDWRYDAVLNRIGRYPTLYWRQCTHASHAGVEATTNAAISSYKALRDKGIIYAIDIPCDR